MALKPVAERAIEGLTNGLSFLDILHLPDSEPTKVEPSGAPPTPPVDLAEFSKRLRERFAELGIDLKSPLRLKLDGRGGIMVDGDHPDRVVVESLFQTDQNLAEQFAAVATFATSQQPAHDDFTAEDFRLAIDQRGETIGFE